MCYKLIIELDVYKNPLDALRLRQMAANTLDYIEQLTALQQASLGEVKKELKHDTFCRWRQLSAMKVFKEAFPGPESEEPSDGEFGEDWSDEGASSAAEAWIQLWTPEFDNTNR